MIDRARHHEQQVREPVDIPDQELVDGRLQPDHPPLGAPADRPREVKRGAWRGAAGQDEMRQRRQVGLEPIDELLEPFDISLVEDRFGDARRNPVGRVGEAGAKREQIALKVHEGVDDVRERRAVRTRAQRREREPEHGIQLVDLAVRVDAAVAFRNACAAEQRCLAGVTGACVDFHGVRNGFFII
jgi:hypothetical protein